ncbi:MAG: AAA family ATPase [Elusimicrobiota bacterium]
MLIEEISIRNFALIEEAVIEPGKGINVLTGETGAGKSMFMDALRFLFGETVTAEFLRPGAAQMEVCARVTLAREARAEAGAILEELGVETEDSSLILRRLYDAKTGKTRAFLGSAPVTGAGLKRWAACAVEFHGQGQSSEILGDCYVQDYLDRWAGLASDAEEFGRAYQLWQAAALDLEERRRFVQEKRDRLGLLQFQKQELQEAALEEETLLQIENDLPLWINRENLAGQLDELEGLVSGSEANAQALVGQSLRIASRLASLPDGAKVFEPLAGALEQCQGFLAEAARQCAALRESLGAGRARVEELLGHKARLERLRIKHQCENYRELRDRLENVTVDLERLENFGHDELRLAREAEQKREHCEQLAGRLSRRREAAARELGPRVTRELRLLGLGKAVFEVEVVRRSRGAGGAGGSPAGSPLSAKGADAAVQSESWNNRGADQAIFWFTPNPGEGRHQAHRIASGGEASRAALALKNLLLGGNSKEPAGLGQVLVLDEIEQGLSARVAALTGDYLKRLGRAHQIFLITHSPVLASSADSHFVLQKNVRQGRTVTEIRGLRSNEERRGEILRLLGAATIQEQRTLAPYVEKLLGLEQKEAA